MGSSTLLTTKYPNTNTLMNDTREKLSHYDLILCSGSPRRLDILRQLGLSPRVIKSTFAEDLDKSQFDHPIEYVAATAREKIREVHNRVISDDQVSPKILIAADTVIIGDGRIFEKPMDYESNVSMLKSFREIQQNGGNICIVTCGYIMFCESNEEKPIEREFRSCTEIRFIKDMSDEFIEEYCQSGEGLEVAGGFKIQGFGSVLFERIHGDYYNCVGLPASRVWGLLSEYVS
jgi:septum formation protein